MRGYLKEGLTVLGATIVLLLLFGAIPDFEFKYKHFNILSDILKSDSLAEELDEHTTVELLGNGEELLALVADSLKMVSSSEPSAQAVKDSLVAKPTLPDAKTSSFGASAEGVTIEDYSSGKKALYPFYRALQNDIKTRPVRIGVLGDSFIEADIITAKLRKLLQSRYGGTGVGFVPIASPAAQYRQTIHHTFSGWTTFSMVYYKKADWKKFCLSGFYFTPNKEGASVTLKTVKNEPVTMISFFFINEKHTKVSVTINNQAPVEYRPESSESVQQLVFSDPAIQSVSIQVKQVEGFTAFGMYLNNTSGVYVDNFSVRGSSGSVLTTMSKELSTQLTQHVPYDLLVIQYGLNVIATDKKWYPSYKKLMVNAIQRLQECYPGVPILMMSVGDKGSKGAEGITTHPGVLPLIEAQRQAAGQAGIAFWNTYQAMGGEKSMAQFVDHKPPMAAKDYTHINYLGGDKIAEQLFESLMKDKARLNP